MTMFKTKEQIEEMAGKYTPENYYECLDRDDLEFVEKNGEQFVSLGEVRRAVYCEAEKAYIEGATQMQKDLLESTSEGFEEWWSNRYPSMGQSSMYFSKMGWQACALSKMKEIQEIKENHLKDEEAWLITTKSRDEQIKEKDAEIERLKKENTEIGIRNSRIYEASHNGFMKYQQAVKDIEWLLNKEYSIVRVKLSNKKETMTCMKHLVEDQDKVQEIRTKYGLDKKEG